jgi:hypothetical protein
METIRRLDVDAVLLPTKSSKPSAENKWDESDDVHVLLSFILNFEHTKSLN